MESLVCNIFNDIIDKDYFSLGLVEILFVDIICFVKKEIICKKNVCFCKTI